MINKPVISCSVVFYSDADHKKKIYIYKLSLKITTLQKLHVWFDADLVTSVDWLVYYTTLYGLDHSGVYEL